MGGIPLKCSRERLNGPIHINCNILKLVPASAAEEETRGCFVTGIYAIVRQQTLEEMIQPHPITQVRMDNITVA